MPACQPCQPVQVQNSFASIMPEDDSDNEEDLIVNAVQQTSQIKGILKQHAEGQLQKLTPKQFEDLKNDGTSVQPLTPERIAAIGSMIKNGLMKLPECADDEIWCMVDSGSAPPRGQP